ncbi:hypothetical protein BKA70DRAFT_1277831 [Coprinopsis sp. MPI-PUGE-AT-0042]|nr:hypothetical protein BKA70DRAFT_1277831 [Coprinopsis sp. MPI-PUGE-AT-0042]
MPGDIEVIDVDLLDDDVGQQPLAGPSRAATSTSQRQSTISIVDDDSDDEIQLVGMRVPPTNRPTHHRNHPGRAMFSPPPPPILPPFPPPVPQVPARYANQTGYPPSRSHSFRPHRVMPPVVRPADRDLLPLRRRSSSPPMAGPSNAAPGPSRPIRAAPRSHHVPSLGLGGALIAHNRARTAAERQGRAINALRRIYPGHGAMHLDFAFEDALEEFALDNDWRDLLPLPDYHGFGNLGRDPLREPQQYLPAYTHPNPAEPGFTYDFQPTSASDTTLPNTSTPMPIIINDDGEEVVEAETKSKSQEENSDKSSTVLVCARCQDPFVLNAGLSPTNAIQRRIWGLRCGHLIDGKCMNEIGQPAVAVAAIVDRKGKGKAKAEVPSASAVPYGEEPSSHHHQDQHLQDETNIPREGEASIASSEVSTAGNSIRSRLRSQNHAATPSTAAPPPADPVGAVEASPPSTLPAYGAIPLQTIGSKKRKRGGPGKGSTRKPKVEEEFQWNCPVPSCGQVHVSVKMSGAWGPEKERQVSRRVPVSMLSDLEKGPRGAIPIFA